VQCPIDGSQDKITK